MWNLKKENSTSESICNTGIESHLIVTKKEKRGETTWELGTNTNALLYVKCCAVLSRSVVSDSATPWTEAATVLCPWDSPDKNIGVS